VKIGAENKKELRWMIALLAVALLVGIYNFADFGTSSAAPPATTTSTTSTGATKKGAAAVDPTLDPRLHTETLITSQNIKYQPGRNIFRMEELPPQTPIASVRMGPEAPPTPTPAPTPPPINLKFYGFASKPNEPKKIFLSDDTEVFVAKQGDIVERKYKVAQINNNSVLIEDLLYNNKQMIPLTPR